MNEIQDSILGESWVEHDRGLPRYSSNIVRPQSGVVPGNVEMVTVRIGGVGFDIMGEFDAAVVKKMYAGFVQSLPGNVKVRVEMCDYLPPAESLGAEPNRISMWDRNGYACGYIDCTKIECAVWVKRSDRYFAYAFDSFLGAALSVLAPLFGSILLHCSLVDFESGVTAFSGPCDMGKSTLARMLCNTGKVLSEDVGLIVCGREFATVFPTPFLFKEFPPLAVSRRLGRLVFLHRADKPEMVHLEFGDAIGELTANTLFYGKDCEAFRQIAALAGRCARRLISQVEAWSLGFNARHINLGDVEHKDEVVQLIGKMNKQAERDGSQPTFSTFDVLSRAPSYKSRPGHVTEHEEVWVSGKQYLWGLSDLASAVWRACATQRAMTELLDTILSEERFRTGYGEQDVLDAIRDLESANLLRRM